MFSLANYKYFNFILLEDTLSHCIYVISLLLYHKTAKEILLAVYSFPGLYATEGINF